jgi:hypothetical protein
MIDQGFTVALTPAQLAAVLSGGTLDGQGSNWVRAWGGLKLLFGGLEALGAGALILTPEPTMVTKGAGVALGAHGIDTFQSGSRQFWSGVETRTATSDGTAALAKALGVDEATAQRIGDDVDMAVPIALTLGLGAARIAAVRGGRIILAEHEATALRAGGHTIARHVGRTDAELAERLAKSRLKTVSTFTTLREAEMAVSQVARANRTAIQIWARAAKVGDTEAFASAFGGNGVGRVMLRDASTTVPGRSVKIVLKKEAVNGKLYYILTAFPGV